MAEGTTGGLRAVAIMGPTAAGKSALALELAEAAGVPILCCDSVQVYRGLDIGSAKATASERSRVRHHLLDMVEPDEAFSAGRYGAAAREVLAAGGPAIISGGTGLYLRSLGWTTSGLDENDGPSEARNDDRSAGRRASLEASWTVREDGERGAIHAELARRDPVTAAEVHPNNIVRALRALWLCELHGAPVSEVRASDPPRRLVDLLMIVLDPGVDAVDRTIETRCRQMLAAGWVREVEKLLAAGYDSRHKAMRSLGYRELLDHLAGRTTLEQATSAVIRATRKYARRQRTYFRHQFRPLLPPEHIVYIDHPKACPSARVEAFLSGKVGPDRAGYDRL